MWGILSEKPLVVQALIKAGADVNPRLQEGASPLMIAVQSLSLEMTKLLLRAGADVNTRNSIGYTALMVAAEDSYPRYYVPSSLRARM